MERINKISESKQNNEFTNILKGYENDLTNTKLLLQKKRKQIDYNKENQSTENYKNFLLKYFLIEENKNQNLNGNSLKSLSFTMKEDLELNESFNSNESFNINKENQLERNTQKDLKIIGLVNLNLNF